MNDLRILFSNQPPFFQAVAVVLAALGLILLISVVHEVWRLLAPWFVHWSARRYLNKVVRFEDRRRRELNAVSRSGGRS